MVSASHFDAVQFTENRSEDHESSAASHHLFDEASGLLMLAAARRGERQSADNAEKGNRSERKSDAKTERGSEKIELAELILRSAESLQGESLWKSDPVNTKNGRLGCAISVSKALKGAGIDVGEELSVRKLERKLLNRDWTKHPLDDAQPGDVAVGHNNELGTNHVGIISRSGSLWNNSSRTLSDPRWANEPVVVGLRPGWLFDGYEERFVLRPPSK